MNTKSYVFGILRRRKNDVTLDALTKSVNAMVAVGNRPALMIQRSMIEKGIEDGTHTPEQLQIVDAGLSALGSEELKKAVREQNALDAIIDNADAETIIEFLHKARGTDLIKSLNSRLAERQNEAEQP